MLKSNQLHDLLLALDELKTAWEFQRKKVSCDNTKALVYIEKIILCFFGSKQFIRILYEVLTQF